MVKCVGRRNENMISVNSLVVQCLGLGAFTAWGKMGAQFKPQLGS